MIYLIIFFSSFFFLWLATKKRNTLAINVDHNNSKLVIPWIFIGITIPALLAALRDPIVGTDVSFYVVPYFNRAVHASSFTSYTKRTSGDVIYNLVNYIISRFTDNIFWLFLAIELIILIFVFMGFWNLREYISPSYSMLVYYFLFYNMTLSTVRQNCSMAIIFYALSMIIANKFIKKSIISASVLILIAVGFHTTAIVGYPLMLFFYFVTFFKPEKIYIIVIIIIASVFLRITMSSFLRLLQNLLSIINDKYTGNNYYLFSDVGAGGYTVQILLGAIVTIIAFMLIKRKKKDVFWNKINTTLFYLDIIYLCFMVLMSNFAFVPRMMYYIQVLWIVTIAQFGNIFVQNSTNKAIARIGSTVLVFAFWMFFYIYAGVHGTFPYIMAN